jgi:hypothetical protein
MLLEIDDLSHPYADLFATDGCPVYAGTTEDALGIDRCTPIQQVLDDL